MLNGNDLGEMNISNGFSGFANAKGGILYIGIDDSGKVYGLKHIEKLLEDIPNKIKNLLGLVIDVNLQTRDGKEYLEIVVEPSSQPVSYKGTYYYRSGSTLQELTGPKLVSVLLKKQGRSWDSLPNDEFSLSSVDAISLDLFREKGLQSKRLQQGDIKLPNKELLEKLNLYDGKQLSNAAALLFGKDTNNYILNSHIKIGYFRTESELLYQDEVFGSLLMQVEKTLDLLLTKYMVAAISYEGVIRVERFPFPREAIREAVLNAVIHKDYLTYNPIQIKVFADRLYISNGGTLPEDWTKEKLLGNHQSVPHNPGIANTFFKAGYVESWGRGIQKILSSCEEYDIPHPEYEVLSSSVTIYFSNPGVSKNTRVEPSVSLLSIWFKTHIKNYIVMN